MSMPDEGPVGTSFEEGDEDEPGSERSRRAPLSAETLAVLALINTKEKTLRWLAYCITQRLEVSRDIVQDLRIRMLERNNLHRFNDAEHMLAHVLTVTRNLALDWRKRKSRQVEIVYCDDPDVLHGVQCEHARIEDADSPEAVWNSLRPHLDVLTAQEIYVFHQRFLGVEFYEIAQDLDICEATVKKHQANAARKLRTPQVKGALE
jgi:RNA polymerase sigma factor (sigma-70 family)